MRFIRSFKLSDWCLKIVAENLNLFIRNKNIPRRHIDFLLRRYPEDIFREYCSLNTISEESMVWFLNPHTKKVTLSIINEKVLNKLKVVGINITSLSLRLSLATENILNSIICCVPHLKYLDLNGTSCSNKTLFLLQKMCPELLSLNLSECDEISNQGMINLCDGSKLSLKYLNIMDTDVEYVGLRYILTRMPFLESLKFNNLGDALCFAHEYEYINDTYANIQYNLTELTYEGTELCGDPVTVILMWTYMCPKVKKVHFLCPVNEAVLHMCTRFRHLEEIKVKTLFNHKFTRIKDAITPILPIASNLKTLILSCVKIPIITLIENFINLEGLFLNNVQFSDFKKEDIKATENKLDTLVIKDNNFKVSSTTSKAIALLLLSSKNVTHLSLNCTSANIPEEIFFIALNSMKKLSFVDFSYCNVKMSSIKRFFEVPTMKKIYLDLCNVNFSDPALENIHMHNSPCTLSWQIKTDNPDDSDSDVFSDDG